MVLLINDKYRIYDISMADMLKSLLSKSSKDDTFPFTRETMTNFEIARISSMHNINFTYTLHIRYFTTKYLSHRSTCYLRAKFLPYKARFQYQKWVHFEESSSHKKEMCRNYSVRVPFPFRILDVNKLIKKPAENKIHKIKIDHV